MMGVFSRSTAAQFMFLLPRQTGEWDYCQVPLWFWKWFSKLCQRDDFVYLFEQVGAGGSSAVSNSLGFYAKVGLVIFGMTFYWNTVGILYLDCKVSGTFFYCLKYCHFLSSPAQLVILSKVNKSVILDFILLPLCVRECFDSFQVIRRLRERGEPIRLFGETDYDAFQRLRKIEILAPEVNKVRLALSYLLVVG